MLQNDSPLRDLTTLAESGELEPAYGREKEILMIISLLARRHSKNVVLVGPKGVGKTRILEGLAVAGNQGDTDGLLDVFRIVELDIGMVLFGGAANATRLRSMMRHLRQEKDNILCIDGIDQVLESPKYGEQSEDDPRAVVIPPVLRGEVSCVATTTPERFQELEEQNPTVWTQFDIFEIKPMTAPATLNVLEKIRPTLERHHQVKISDAALRDAVVFTEQFMPDSYLPGKAIEAIDRACSRFRFKTVASEKHPDMLAEESIQIMTGEVTSHDVSRVVEKLSSTRVDRRALPDEWDVFERRLKRALIGQKVAVTLTVATLKRVWESLERGRRPSAVMLFVGPEGAGKGLMARRLAALLYDSQEKIVEFSMADFSAEQFVETLTALPAQDKGDSSITITSVVPASVIVFDQIEACDPDVFDFLLPILDQGYYRFEDGKEISLTSSVLVFTTMVGSDDISREVLLDDEASVVSDIRGNFRSQFLDLVDEVVPFVPLEPKHVKQIIRSPINKLRRELQKKGISVGVHEQAYDYIAKRGMKKTSSVDDLMGTVDKLVIRPIQDIASNRQLRQGTVLHVQVEDDRIVIRNSRNKSVPKKP